MLAACLCAAPLAAQGGKDDKTPATGKLLYVDTTEQDKTYLAEISPDGKNKVRLTPAYNNIVFPKKCETTGMIGFTNKTPDMKSEVIILDKEAGSARKILDGAALEGFTPDGTHVLFTTCTMNPELGMYNLKDKKSFRISDKKLKVTAADASPDGKWVAVSAFGEDDSSDIYMISALAQGVFRITQTPGVNESFPVFGNDSRRLVYMTDKSGNQELEYSDSETKQAHRPALPGMYPSLSPDNKWVAFQQGEEVCIARVNGLDTKAVIQGRTPTWTK